MNVNIEIKVKMDKGKELVLKGEEAKELYLKLKEIYERRVEYVPYRYWPWYLTTTSAPQPNTWYQPLTWSSSSGTYAVSVRA